MSRRILLCTLVVVLGTLAGARSSQAASYYFPESWGSKATYVYRLTGCYSAGTYTFETFFLSSGADTVMHLQDSLSGVELAYNDDYGGTLASRIVYSVSGPGCKFLTVYVRAYSNTSGGYGGKTFSFRINGVGYGTHKLGGYRLADLNVATSESMETILVNNGAPATFLMRLEWDGNHYRVASNGVDTTAGVGAASKLWGAAPTTRWIIGTPTEAMLEGPVRAARNDRLLGDSDGDLLGNNLELEACTCSTGASVVCPGAATVVCSSVSNYQDTDGDGLRDDWELIGSDDVSKPQLFALWGASPRHRDMFVEVDWLPGDPDGAGPYTSMQLSEDKAKTAHEIYAQAAGVTNWDGVDGVAVHFDIGQPCTQEPGDQDGITSICGNFGGATEGGTYDGNNGCTQEHNAFVSDARRNKFFWMLSSNW